VIRSSPKAALLGLVLALQLATGGAAAFGGTVLCVMPDGTAVVENALTAARCSEGLVQAAEGLACALASDSCTDILIQGSACEITPDRVCDPKTSQVQAVPTEPPSSSRSSVGIAEWDSGFAEKRLHSRLRRSVVLQV